MKMRHLIWLTPFPLCLAVVACDGKSPGADGASATTSVAETDIAVPADFEDKATSEITTDNYKKELEKLEAEAKR